MLAKAQSFVVEHDLNWFPAFGPTSLVSRVEVLDLLH